MNNMNDHGVLNARVVIESINGSFDVYGSFAFAHILSAGCEKRGYTLVYAEDKEGIVIAITPKGKDGT